MQGRREEDGRRPLIVPGSSRHMLQEVNKSLNQVVRLHQQQQQQQQQQQHYGSPYASSGVAAADTMQIKPGDLGARPELSKSTPNLADKSGGGGSTGSRPSLTRLGYNQRAMAQIKQSLAEFQVSPGALPSLVANGYDVEMTPVKPHMVRQLTLMGCDEAVAIRALKLCGNKSVEAAMQVIQKLAQPPDSSKNGFAKMMGNADLQQYPNRVMRKPSFEKKYRTESPVNSENSSVRSESPVPSAINPAGLHHMDPLRYTSNMGAPHHVEPPRYASNPSGPWTNQEWSPGAATPKGFQSISVLNNGHAHLAASQSYPDGLSQMTGDSVNSVGAIPGHVQPGVMSRMTPIQHPQPRRPVALGNTPITPQRTTMATPNNTAFSPLTPRQQTLGSHTAGPQPASMMLVQERSIVTSQQSAVPRSHGMVGSPVPGLSAGQASSPMYSQSVGPGQVSQGHPAFRLDYGMSQMTLDDHSPLSSHSSSPGLVGGADPSSHGYPPKPVQAWNAKQPAIFLLQAKSREVERPILQTATAPRVPPVPLPDNLPSHQDNLGAGPLAHDHPSSYVSSVQAHVNSPATQPSYHLPHQPQTHHTPPSHHLHPPHHSSTSKNVQIELTSGPGGLRGQALQSDSPVPPSHLRPHTPGGGGPGTRGRGPGMIQIHIQNQGKGNVNVNQSLAPAPASTSAGYVLGAGMSATPAFVPPSSSSSHAYMSDSPIPRTYNNQSPLSVISTTSTPSTNSDMPMLPPAAEKLPPPYPGKQFANTPTPLTLVPTDQSSQRHAPPITTQELLDRFSATDHYHTDSVPLELAVGPAPSQDPDTDSLSSSDKQSELLETHHCTSPKPERTEEAERRDLIRQETKIKHFSSQACKFYIEQHFENIIKSHREREKRQHQLEKEMDKIGLSEDARHEMRKMLHQKESNYIRLKRAKIDKSMFTKIKSLGVGAFGEVALVCKDDTKQLFAMKTLRKKDVYQRNQVAHVKAERDILAEADNEWVVKLYYSFQDKSHLYFVMDYIPGGDMMSLLIKFGIFDEELARFYIAELVLAIQSVHKMGFIHRDIKPDNILIDKDGHIKLTDFGLCTGFRWTHSSKIYQSKGNHAYQDSMDPDESCWGDIHHQLTKEILSKPLERRQLRQRSLAHSLVGTPNYIAPEVLLRQGYTACCDWWSVGVILYEMVVGQPPFYAESPRETQMKVINFEKTLHIPPEANLSSPAADLICRLCTGPERRLGRNGAEEIQKHSFFRPIQDFDQLRQQPALYKPTIQYATDTSNFDAVDPDPDKLRRSSSGNPGGGGSDPQQLKGKDGASPGDPSNGKNPEHAFFEFTFRRFFDEGGNAYAQRIEDPDSNSPVYV